MKMYLAAVFAAAAVLTGCAIANDDAVINFNVGKQDPATYDYVIDLKPWEFAPQVQNFAFKNCGNPETDVANVISIKLGPDPVVFPGPLTVSFQVDIKEVVDAPVVGNVTLEKKAGEKWIKIPCIGIIGSCTYPDVCDLLKHAVCPPPFAAKNIPCKCPFRQGNFSLPSSEFTVSVPVFPAGDYHAVGQLAMNGKRVACVDLSVTFG